MARELPTAASLNASSAGTFVELVGVTILSVEQGRLVSEMAVRPALIAPNSFLHAAAVVALADTTAGYGARAHLPDGASGFTTIELKANFLGTAREGMLDCVSTLAHAGRSTQVWDATVTDRASGKTLALFRATQMVLYPRASS